MKIRLNTRGDKIIYLSPFVFSIISAYSLALDSSENASMMVGKRSFESQSFATKYVFFIVYYLIVIFLHITSFNLEISKIVLGVEVPQSPYSGHVQSHGLFRLQEPLIFAKLRETGYGNTLFVPLSSELPFQKKLVYPYYLLVVDYASALCFKRASHKASHHARAIVTSTALPINFFLSA